MGPCVESSGLAAEAGGDLGEAGRPRRDLQCAWLALACWELGWGKPDRNPVAFRHSDEVLEARACLAAAGYCAVGRGKLGGDPISAPTSTSTLQACVFKRHPSQQLTGSDQRILKPLQNGPRNFGKGTPILSPFSQQVAPTEQVQHSSGLGCPSLWE